MRELTVASLGTPSVEIRKPTLTEGELRNYHRAKPDFIHHKPIRVRVTDAPIRNPDDPLRKVDQAGLDHFGGRKPEREPEERKSLKDARVRSP